jgi:hypothetical protein
VGKVFGGGLFSRRLIYRGEYTPLAAVRNRVSRPQTLALVRCRECDIFVSGGILSAKAAVLAVF